MKASKRNAEDKDTQAGDEGAEGPSRKMSKARPGPSRGKPTESGISRGDGAYNSLSSTEDEFGIGEVSINSDFANGSEAAAENVKFLREIKTQEPLDYIYLGEEDGDESFPTLPAPINEESCTEDLHSTSSAAAEIPDPDQPSTSTSAKSSCRPGTFKVVVKQEKTDDNHDVKPDIGLDLFSITSWLNTQNQEYILMKKQVQMQTKLRKKAESELKKAKLENDLRVKEMQKQLQESERKYEKMKTAVAAMETTMQQFNNSCSTTIGFAAHLAGLLEGTKRELNGRGDGDSLEISS